ncbi:uncharacterized protein FOMMEDRAFT_98445, partial [Fomitiporia mediterranea MF3/22]
NFTQLTRLLIHLTKHNVLFEFCSEHIVVIDKLKDTVINSPALCAINYELDIEVIVTVDSSIISVGFYLRQEHLNSYYKEIYVKPPPGNLIDRLQNGQILQLQKVLYRLKQAVKDKHWWQIQLRKLVVEMDTVYVKSMINNSDLQSNATINRWIARILLFNFEF